MLYAKQQSILSVSHEESRTYFGCSAPIHLHFSPIIYNLNLYLKSRIATVGLLRMAVKHGYYRLYLGILQYQCIKHHGACVGPPLSFTDLHNYIDRLYHRIDSWYESERVKITYYIQTIDT